MRKHINIISIVSLAVVLAFPAAVFAQEKDWRPCPRCQSNQQMAAELAKVEKQPFNPKDLSGIWGNFGIQLDSKTVPSLTPQGMEMWRNTRAEPLPGEAPSEGQTKDPMMICDPLGWPRLFTHNYGFQFAYLPDRVVQFFEINHTWRDIWTDGRKLPERPPTSRFMGYSIGRWEGNTFVVESSGYDDRTWLDQDRRAGRDARKYGWPHSDQMKVVERYERTSYTTLDVSLSVVDPVMFTEPWVTKGTIKLNPGTEIWEEFCIPSDSAEYNRLFVPEQNIRSLTGGSEK